LKEAKTLRPADQFLCPDEAFAGMPTRSIQARCFRLETDLFTVTGLSIDLWAIMVGLSVRTAIQEMLMMNSQHYIYGRAGAALDIPSSANFEPRGHSRVEPRSDAPIEAPAALDVVIATDFSEHAAHAASRVAMLAKEANMHAATVLHVLEESPVKALRHIFNTSPNAATQRSRHVKRQLEAIAGELRQRTGLATESRDVAGSRLRIAALADLLVIGAQGNRPVRDFLIGSTAQRLLRRISRPILVVRRRPEAPYRRVLIAVDFQRDPSNALDYAERLAPRATLDLVHAYDVPFEGKMRYAGASGDVIDSYRAEARTSAARNMAAVVLSRTSPAVKRTFIVYGHAANELLEKEKEIEADLVIVSRRDKSLTEELLFGGVVPRLLADSKCDVLVVP
jgi:nucleotide-binding universal stress UspA family protein